MPRNAAIELRFDRFLMHSTAVRQSVTLHSGRPEFQVFLLPEYDVLERVVRFRPSEPLVPNNLYTFDVALASDQTPLAFQAFDGARLVTGPVPLQFRFYTSNSLLPDEAPCEPTCQEMSIRFRTGGCARQGCHNSEADPATCDAHSARDHDDECVGVPRMGLALNSLEGLAYTAIDRVAHQTETGPQGGTPLANPARMGIQMPLIDRGNPGNSYLLYKLLIRPPNLASPADETLTAEERDRRARCTPRYRTAATEPADGPAESRERERLRDWFVRGEGMPLVSRSGNPSVSPVTRDWLYELQRFIAAGAPCP